MPSISIEKPRIVFVFPRVLKEIYYEGCDYHLGAAYIRAYLAEKGFASEQYIDSGSETPAEVAKRLVAKGSDVIGFSVYDANYYYVKILANAIKRASKSIKIICGGPTATFSDNLILEDCAAVD